MLTYSLWWEVISFHFCSSSCCMSSILHQFVFDLYDTQVTPRQFLTECISVTKFIKNKNIYFFHLQKWEWKEILVQWSTATLTYLGAAHAGLNDGWSCSFAIWILIAPPTHHLSLMHLQRTSSPTCCIWPLGLKPVSISKLVFFFVLYFCFIFQNTTIPNCQMLPTAIYTNDTQEYNGWEKLSY